MRQNKFFKNYGIGLVGLLILGVLALIFIGFIQFLFLFLIPIVLLYFILEELKIDNKIKKIIWIIYFIILLFLLLERVA